VSFCPISLLVYLMRPAADFFLQFGRIGLLSFRFVGG